MMQVIKVVKYGCMLGMAVLLAACQTPLQNKIETPAAAPVPAKTPALISAPLFMVSKWEMLPDWPTQNLAPSWGALQQSCRALEKKNSWQEICVAAAKLDQNEIDALRVFYETWFTPYQVFNADGSENGLITGYYEPLLQGSREQSERFRFPLYAVPDDLLEIDLSEVYPQLKGMRLRGKLQGRKVVPYFSRGEIDRGTPVLKGRALFWVENAVDLFFLQIQGSGRIALPDGAQVKVGYADQNGHPYLSVGKKLIEQGELKPEEASMQGIKNWAEKNPAKLPKLLALNPSYVFFRELPATLTAPLGALGVPLTNEYSIAVDPRTVPLGAPVFLATTQPNSGETLNRLMFAQDTGGAIKGAVRADFFWGFGDEAASKAGSMKQAGRMWILFPKGAEPATNLLN